MSRWEERLAEMSAPVRRSPAPMLGIDPGKDGGAVLLSPEGKDLLWWADWTWLEGRKTRPDAWRVRCSNTVAGSVEVEHMTEVLRVMARFLDQEINAAFLRGAFDLSVEGMFIPPKRKRKPGEPHKGPNLQTLIRLFEQAGMCMQAFAPPTNRPIHRPLAAEWRSRCLSMPRGTIGKAADTIANKRARQVWKNFPAPGECNRHLADAAWVAYDGCRFGR